MELHDWGTLLVNAWDSITSTDFLNDEDGDPLDQRKLAVLAGYLDNQWQLVQRMERSAAPSPFGKSHRLLTEAVEAVAETAEALHDQLDSSLRWMASDYSDSNLLRRFQRAEQQVPRRILTHQKRTVAFVNEFFTVTARYPQETQALNLPADSDEALRALANLPADK